MKTTRVPLPYAPRRCFLPFHDRGQRFAVGVAHRRCGKTVACINDMIRRAVLSEKPMYRAAYVAPFLKQAKDVAWDYLKAYSRPLWTKPPNESELYVELVNGQRIKIFGADNPDALRGGYLDDVTLDEYADMHPILWGSVIRPMLSDRLGSATFIGTPKGRNAFHALYVHARADPSWFTFFLPASATGIIEPAELADARRMMTPEQFEQEYECSFDAAILGAYYGRDIAALERRGQITTVDPVPGEPVHTAWDLGIGDATAIWFWQAVGAEIRVLDHYAASGRAIPHYVAAIDARAFVQGLDYVPHDARVRSLETGRTRLETLVGLGRKPVLVPAHKIMDGINAVRLTLPHVWFDAERCRDGIESLRQYRADYDDKARTFKDTPKHDWSSHDADAFRYLAMAWRARTATPPRPAGPDFKRQDHLTMDEFLALEAVKTRDRI